MSKVYKKDLFDHTVVSYRVKNERINARATIYFNDGTSARMDGYGRTKREASDKLLNKATIKAQEIMYGLDYEAGRLTHLSSVSISGDVLTVKGSLDYYQGNNWDNTTRMSNGTYQFKLTSQTTYGEGTDEGLLYMSKSEFISSTGPVLYITVANGVVTELCYGA